MEAVSPDIAKKLLSRDFANLFGRVQKGGKLTRSERAMLQTLATGTGAAPTNAASYVELAAILGITRQSLNNWKKRKDAPKPTANGMHNVAAWREFMRRNGLKGGEIEQPGDIESSLKARKSWQKLKNDNCDSASGVATTWLSRKTATKYGVPVEMLWKPSGPALTPATGRESAPANP